MDHYMDTLDESKKLLYKGMKDITQKGDLNASTLEMLGNVVDALKDIEEIKGKEMGMDEGSYQRMMPVYYGGYEARGRMRDSRGRYMDGGYDAYGNYGAGNYGESYRKDGEDPEYLEYKMRNAQSDQEREMYRRKLEQAKNR